MDLWILDKVSIKKRSVSLFIRNQEYQALMYYEILLDKWVVLLLVSNCCSRTMSGIYRNFVA